MAEGYEWDPWHHSAHIRNAGWMEPTSENLPESLTLDEAYRAAFYMALQYLKLESDESRFVLFVQYLWTDPARWGDWQSAVSTAIG